MIFSNLAAKLLSERTAWNPEEQRMSRRLWEYWNTLRGGRRLPSRAEFTVETVADLGQYGVTLELVNQENRPVFRFVGKALTEECGQDLTGRSLADAPAHSVLAWVVKNYADVAEQKAPIGFEDESVDGNASTKLRGILLPFSENGEQVDFIVGAVTFKRVLSEITFKAPSDDPAGDGETVVVQVFRDRLAKIAALTQVSVSTALAEQLAQCQALARKAEAADTRSRAALYHALQEAYAFYFQAEINDTDYAYLLASENIIPQARAPFTPVIKLVFGKDYDKTRISEYSTALSFAKRHNRSAADVMDFFQNQEGGLKGCVKAERQARRVENGAPADNLDQAMETMRGLPPIGEVIVEALGGPEFVVLLGRRSAARPGLVHIVKQLSERQSSVDAMVKRAAKACAGSARENDEQPPTAIAGSIQQRI